MVKQKRQTLFEVFFTSNSLSFNVSLFFLKDGGVKNTHAEHLEDSPNEGKIRVLQFAAKTPLFQNDNG